VVPGAEQPAVAAAKPVRKRGKGKGKGGAAGEEAEASEAVQKDQSGADGVTEGWSCALPLNAFFP